MLTVGIIGTRGIPNTYGGFERFVELLVGDQRWEADGVSFRVYGEGADEPHNSWTELCSVGCTKANRPFWYYFRSAYLATKECDIVLCCGVALSVFAFWPGLRGKVLIVNPDGCEWRRTKWSKLGRLAIWAMYSPALWAARYVVIDADALRADFRLASDARYIPYYGPQPRKPLLAQTTRQSFDLHRPYALVIARLEPENNIGMIVEAFAKLAPPNLDLIIVGSKSTPFFRESLAELGSDRIRFLGAIYDQDVLDQLRANAIAYIHGHSVGGTNPSLLEALATVTGRLLCHDNKYNREVAGEEAAYFMNPAELAALIEETFARACGAQPLRREPTQDVRFHPDTIYNSYLDLFRDAHASR